MPDAVVTTVTKAIVAELADGTFSQEFTPERSYADWAKSLEFEAVGGSGLTVDVVGHQTDQVIQVASRGTDPKLKYIVEVDIAVRRKFAPEFHDDDHGRVLLAKVDELCLLVQEIHEHFLLTRLPDELGVVWNEPAKIMVNPHRDHLKDWKQFTGIVQLSLAAFKESGVA